MYDKFYNNEYDMECIFYLSLQIAKSPFFKDKWCYIDIYFEEIKKLYEMYKKEDDINVSLLDSINNYIDRHKEEIIEKMENAFEGGV